MEHETSKNNETAQLGIGAVMPSVHSLYCPVTGIYKKSCWHCRYKLTEKEWMSIELSYTLETGRLYSTEA